MPTKLAGVGIAKALFEHPLISKLYAAAAPYRVLSI
jgi:hypothetical protein